MAAQTPLPLNLRRGLTAFSSSLFINNKTRDSGAACIYRPGTSGGGAQQSGAGGFSWAGGFSSTAGTQFVNAAGSKVSQRPASNELEQNPGICCR